MPPKETGRVALTVTQPNGRCYQASDNGRFVLRLYVTGATPASTRAIACLKALCEERLKGRYELEVIDIFQQPALLNGEQIIATPTLVKHLPLPLQRFIGNMDGLTDKLFGLDMLPRAEPPKG